MEITRMAFAANMLIHQVVQVKKGESVVIVTDTDRPTDHHPGPGL